MKSIEEIKVELDKLRSGRQRARKIPEEIRKSVGQIAHQYDTMFQVAHPLGLSYTFVKQCMQDYPAASVNAKKAPTEGPAIRTSTARSVNKKTQDFPVYAEVLLPNGSIIRIMKCDQNRYDNLVNVVKAVVGG